MIVLFDPVEVVGLVAFVALLVVWIRSERRR
jgi:hypothetical protein